jgi:hypothetical protein
VAALPDGNVASRGTKGVTRSVNAGRPVVWGERISRIGIDEGAGVFVAFAPA